MDEFSGSAARDVSRPTPPRWKGVQSLDLVRQINERCIELLHELAVASDRGTTLSAVIDNRELWTGVGIEARRAMARMPFVIVDVNFRNDAWWRRAAEGKVEANEVEELSNGLTHDVREPLMHEITMFAWQTARWDQGVAQLLLAMSPLVANIIATLTPQQIRTIATHQSQAVQIRRHDDAQFWRDLLVAAIAQDEGRLSDLHIHAKLSLCGRVTPLRLR